MKNFKLLILLVFAVNAYSAVLYVDKDMGDGFWMNSYTCLNEAISAARAGDEIWVAAGVYHPGDNRSDSFVLKPSVKIYGGFNGGENNLSARDVHKNPTILCGDIGVSGDHSDNVHHVLYYSGALSQETVVDGFIIRNGYADNGTGGGGLYLANGAEPLIANCRFVNNRSTAGGGAVSLEDAPVFKQCLFEANHAVMGGAVYSPELNNKSNAAVILRSTFVLNTAGTGSALFFDKRQSVSVDSTVFWQNTNLNGTVNSFSLNTTGGSNSSVSNSACDDTDIQASNVHNIIYYQSSEENGPFRDTENYLLDKHHGIPQDYGWYYVPAPLVLNIRVFLEGPM